MIFHARSDLNRVILVKCWIEIRAIDLDSDLSVIANHGLVRMQMIRGEEGSSKTTLLPK